MSVWYNRECFERDSACPCADGVRTAEIKALIGAAAGSAWRAVSGALEAQAAT